MCTQAHTHMHTHTHTHTETERKRIAYINIIIIDKCILHLSSEKCLFAIGTDHYRKNNHKNSEV